MEINRLICSIMVQIKTPDNKIVFVGEDIEGRGDKLSINFPNANLKTGEDFKDGAKRQIFETTGLDAREEDIEFVGIIETYKEEEKNMLVLYKIKVSQNMLGNILDQSNDANTEKIFWESLPNIRDNKYKLSKYFNLALKLYTTKFIKCVCKVKEEKEEITFFI